MGGHFGALRGAVRGLPSAAESGFGALKSSGAERPAGAGGARSAACGQARQNVAAARRTHGVTGRLLRNGLPGRSRQGSHESRSRKRLIPGERARALLAPFDGETGKSSFLDIPLGGQGEAAEEVPDIDEMAGLVGMPATEDVEIQGVVHDPAGG